MLSAKQSRERTEAVLKNREKDSKKLAKELEIIESTINKAIQEGSGVCFIDDLVSEEAILELQRLGYQIDEQEGSVYSRYKPVTVISW